MSQQKKKLVALTFKIHPDLLEEIDNLIDNIGYRSRGHVINRIVDDWLNRFHRNPRKDKKKMATFSNAMDAVKQGNGIQRSSWNGVGRVVWMMGNPSPMTLRYLYIEYPPGHPTKPGLKCPWVASQDDMMSDDWVIIEPPR
jgi:hypothetical protein